MLKRKDGTTYYPGTPGGLGVLTRRTWIARCPKCKAHARIEAGTRTAIWNKRPAVACTCGASMSAKPLDGRVSEAHKCGARCLASKGHVCECSCGGKNHGTNA